MDYRPRPPAGRSASPRRSGSGPFLPALLVGALAAGDLGIDFDGTDFAFLEQAAVPGRRARAARGRRPASAAARAGRAATPAVARRCSALALVLGALDGGRLARRPRPHVVPGLLVGVACARRSASSPRASLFARVRARGSTPRPRARCRSTREGAGAASRAGALGPLPAAGVLVDRRARVAAARRPPPRRARSTPACGSCGERRRGAEEARPRRHRRDEARDARAGGRDRPRAGAAAADGARAATSTTASPRSRR